MLLQRLTEYAARLDLPPTLYSEGPLRYVIDLDREGHLVNRRPIDVGDPSNPRTRRGQRRLLPQIQRTVAVTPLLLADKADYVLGVGGPDSKPERVAACHQAFMDLVDRCAAHTRSPEVAAVQQFLRAGPLAQLELGEGFDSSGVITFRVEGVFPIDLPAVQSFWAAENDPAVKNAPIMQCVVCGEDRPVLDRLQARLKGVPGGQTSGTAIISANADAFESYGLAASLIAPTCADCGERFTKAANDLLAGPTSRVALGGAAYIYWTRQPVGFSLQAYFSDPQPEQVQALLHAVRVGQWDPEVDETQFYATALSGSGGRAVVRDWIDTTVGEVKRHLATWFQRQAVVGGYGEEPRPLGLYALAAAAVRDAQRDLAPPTIRALLHAALTGGPVPDAVLAQAVQRIRAEQAMTRPRAALIKLVLCSKQPAAADSDPAGAVVKEDVLVQLDPSHPEPAYHCGRLLAVLEDVQRLAIPGVKATIVDRFFGSASSAPGSVFPRLVRGAQPHLGKLERDNPGAHRALQRRLEEILGAIDDFPRLLPLRQQGLFALGYYHQHAFDRAQAREAAERRRMGQAADAADALPNPLETTATSTGKEN